MASGAGTRRQGGGPARRRVPCPRPWTRSGRMEASPFVARLHSADAQRSRFRAASPRVRVPSPALAQRPGLDAGDPCGRGGGSGRRRLGLAAVDRRDRGRRRVLGLPRHRSRAGAAVGRWPGAGLRLRRPAAAVAAARSPALRRRCPGHRAPAVGPGRGVQSDVAAGARGTAAVAPPAGGPDAAVRRGRGVLGGARHGRTGGAGWRTRGSPARTR